MVTAEVGAGTGVGSGVSGAEAIVVETVLIAETAATNVFWTTSWIVDVTSDACCPVMFIHARSTARLSVE
jgi:hypothetical protein